MKNAAITVCITERIYQGWLLVPSVGAMNRVLVDSMPLILRRASFTCTQAMQPCKLVIALQTQSEKTLRGLFIEDLTLWHFTRASFAWTMNKKSNAAAH
jgi:hypothetical protein